MTSKFSKSSFIGSEENLTRHQMLKPFKVYNIFLTFIKGGAVGPGMFFVIPCTDEIRVMDLRTVSFDVPPQEILTKDSVTVSVDAVVYYNIRLLLHKNKKN